MSPAFRALLLSVVSSVLLACPAGPSTNDSGMNTTIDGGNPMPMPKCSGGCAANQICNETKRVCEDACGGCDAGFCVKGADGTFSCQAKATTCNGNACEPGQVACIDGNCSCLPFSKAAHDSCSSRGEWCLGNACSSPRRFQECKPEVGGCPANHTCKLVFPTDMISICLKQCTTNQNCDRGEICNGGNCMPASLFQNQDCAQYSTQPDGGTAQVVVTRGNLCLQKDDMGNPTEQTPTGNCQYGKFELFKFGDYTFDQCRPPGAAGLGTTCKQDFAPTAIATQCNTGLECALTSTIDTGICLKVCNAVPERNGFVQQPACALTESCVNLYRQFDPDFNSILGTCMTKCNVFDQSKLTCPAVGPKATSCVPTDPTGTFTVSADGSGVCVPQQNTVAALGAPCTTSDPFRGAACATGQICTAVSSTAQATCMAVCDLTCAGANPPARCNTQPNAKCGGGKTCTRLSSSLEASLGVCN